MPTTLDRPALPPAPPAAPGARMSAAGMPAGEAAGGGPAASAGSAAPGAPAAQDAAAALRLLAGVLCARSFDAAAHRLVATLARDFALHRCTLGRHRDGVTRLVASSALDVTSAAADAELVQRLCGAMDEAITHGAAVSAPPSADDRFDGVRHEHLALQRELGGSVATLPLGVAGELFGALCVERRARPLPDAVGPADRDGAPVLDAATFARLEQLLALALPALRWMERAEQPLRRRLRFELARTATALRHPGRRGLRRLLAAGAVLVVFLAVAPLEREIGGRARIEGAEQRVVAAPVDGFVKTAHVRPGDRVRAGQPLVDLLDSDLKLERERLASQLAQRENGYASAMAKSDRVAASTGMAQIGETQAQLALVDDQLARGRIVAPFDALVIQGDLGQSTGAPVRQGDTLLTLATTGRQRVIVEVDEIDIAQVRPGQAGTLALSSLPWEHAALVVERIAPIARAVEGRNVFEVEARLTGSDAALRPGLLGRADLVVGRSPPLWSWSRHVIDRVRVAWWAWIA